MISELGMDIATAFLGLTLIMFWKIALHVYIHIYAVNALYEYNTRSFHLLLSPQPFTAGALTSHLLLQPSQPQIHQRAPLVCAYTATFPTYPQCTLEKYIW